MSIANSSRDAIKLVCEYVIDTIRGNIRSDVFRREPFGAKLADDTIRRHRSNKGRGQHDTPLLWTGAFSGGLQFRMKSGHEAEVSSNGRPDNVIAAVTQGTRDGRIPKRDAFDVTQPSGKGGQTMEEYAVSLAGGKIYKDADDEVERIARRTR